MGQNPYITAVLTNQSSHSPHSRTPLVKKTGAVGCKFSLLHKDKNVVEKQSKRHHGDILNWFENCKDMFICFIRFYKRPLTLHSLVIYEWQIVRWPVLCPQMPLRPEKYPLAGTCAQTSRIKKLRIIS